MKSRIKKNLALGKRIRQKLDIQRRLANITPSYPYTSDSAIFIRKTRVNKMLRDNDALFKFDLGEIEVVAWPQL